MNTAITGCILLSNRSAFDNQVLVSVNVKIHNFRANLTHEAAGIEKVKD